MGLSGINLRLDKVPFSGTKAIYSDSPTDSTVEENTLPNYKEYLPIDSSSDSTIVDFPNKLTKTSK